MNTPRTRLAPSPTGALHLGNARTFLINWAMARRYQWKTVLRIEDLDTPRVKKNADRDAIDTLSWLGIDWDEGPVYQLVDLERYQSALRSLGEAGLIYPCKLTRSQIASFQSAPHADEHEPRYPGTSRPPDGTPCRYDPGGDAQSCWRLRVPDEAVEFVDGFAGPRSMNVQQRVGDFVVAAKAGLPAYQLAVVVDDAAQGVTHVVRGDDLLSSTPRQIWLYRMMGLSPQPEYFHVPLVLGEDGLRLAKRHGDTRVAMYRSRGVRAERVIGLLAEWCGLGRRRVMDAAEFSRLFSLDTLPRGAVTFTADDDRWLLEGT